jgi:hypothetical protein
MERKRARRSRSWKPCARGWEKILRSWERRRPSWLADKYGYNHSDEDADDEDEDDEGNTAAPPTPVPPTAAAEVIAVNEEDPMAMVPEQEAPKTHEVILADAEPELQQPCLFNMIVRDYEESPSRMMDDLH